MDMAVVITAGPDGSGRPGWTCRVQRENPDHTWRDAQEGDGASEALVDVLRHRVTRPAEGFRVVRLVPPPEATGERNREAGHAHRDVVVGERVVVTWMRDLADAEHPATAALAHLTEVPFLGVPVTHGMLTWRSPSGHEVPCAVATTYLPRARSGWTWGPELVEQRLGAREARSATDAAGLGVMSGAIPLLDSWVEDFPAKIGKLAAKLHLALATASTVLPQPVAWVGPDTVRAWHSAARRRLEAVEQLAKAGEFGDASQVILPRLPALGAAIDDLLPLAEAMPTDADQIAAGKGIGVQHVHGDLHAGQMLRWPRGLAVVGFDGNPMVHRRAHHEDGADPLVQPAARDLAQLLLSVDHIGRIADRGSGFALTAGIDEWSSQAREQLLAAYRGELAVADRQQLLDERLLAAFQAEQVCRDLLYALEYRPSWIYAPLAGLRLMSTEVEEPRPGGRHRATPQNRRAVRSGWALTGERPRRR
jgi:maltokinase